MACESATQQIVGPERDQRSSQREAFVVIRFVRARSTPPFGGLHLALEFLEGMNYDDCRK